MDEQAGGTVVADDAEGLGVDELVQGERLGGAVQLLAQAPIAKLNRALGALLDHALDVAAGQQHLRVGQAQQLRRQLRVQVERAREESKRGAEGGVGVSMAAARSLSETLAGVNPALAARGARVMQETSHLLGVWPGACVDS